MADKKTEIEEYLRQMKLPNYKEYVAAYGKDTEKAFRESLTRADTDYAKARADHGTRAASLLANGLSASGYSDYLDSAAYAARVKTVSAAEKLRAEGEKQNKSGYADFLANAQAEAEGAYEKKQDSISDAFSKLLARHIEDKDAAKEYLITLGVDSETAEALAEQNAGILHGAQTRRNAVLNFAIKNQLFYGNAYKYAIANGLSPSVAHEIATISQSAYDVTYFQRAKDDRD